jgi:hypothetical protein
MPTTREIVDRQLDIVKLLERAVSGSKLKAGEASDCLDLLHGLAAALPVHPHIGQIVFETAREITAKAYAAKSLKVD